MTGHHPPGPGLARFEYHRSAPVTLYLGDAAQVLAAMPDSTVDCVVTSPPYWGQRDYGTATWAGGDPSCPHPGRGRPVAGVGCPACGAVRVDPQYGLEPTLDAYVQNLVGVFGQIRRVLRPSGTCWLNIGDGYSSAAGGAPTSGRPQANGIRATRPRGQDLLPPKNLLGVPWRVALALQSTGDWILRNAVAWAKPNAMPESVTDRLSATYELVFLLTRSPRYHFDLDPIRVPLKHPDAADGSRVFGGVHKAGVGGVGSGARRRGGRYRGKYTDGQAAVEPGAGRGNLAPTGQAHTAAHPRGRNPGDDPLTAPPRRRFPPQGSGTEVEVRSMRDMRALLMDGQAELPRLGEVVAGDRASLPFYVVDASGAEVEPVSAFLRELALGDLSPLTVKSYAHDLLRWWRLLDVLDVVWDKATTDQIAVLVGWLRFAPNPQRRSGSQLPASVNVKTGKASLRAG
jgi:DNA modification methylase